jgi:hypothetical protein
MTAIGRRIRGYIDGGSNNVKLSIRRLKCTGCEKIHHELPDILVPYKRHCSETIEEIIDEKTDAVGCEASTIQKVKRWFAAKTQYFTGCLVSAAAQVGATVAASTNSLLRKMRESRGWLKRLVRIAVNSNLWVHTRSEFVSS